MHTLHETVNGVRASHGHSRLGKESVYYIVLGEFVSKGCALEDADGFAALCEVYSLTATAASERESEERSSTPNTSRCPPRSPTSSPARGLPGSAPSTPQRRTTPAGLRDGPAQQLAAALTGVAAALTGAGTSASHAGEGTGEGEASGSDGEGEGGGMRKRRRKRTRRWSTS